MYGGLCLAHSIRNKTYPERGESQDAAAFIWSKAPKIIHAHDKGSGGARLTPGEWEQRRGMRLRFIYCRKGPSLLVVEKARINSRGAAVASRSKTGRGQGTADIPAGTAGKTAQTARSGGGCGVGGASSARVDCAEVGGKVSNQPV
jgi:hypothetical protein